MTISTGLAPSMPIDKLLFAKYLGSLCHVTTDDLSLNFDAHYYENDKNDEFLIHFWWSPVRRGVFSNQWVIERYCCLMSCFVTVSIAHADTFLSLSCSCFCYNHLYFRHFPLLQFSFCFSLSSLLLMTLLSFVLLLMLLLSLILSKIFLGNRFPRVITWRKN